MSCPVCESTIYTLLRTPDMRKCAQCKCDYYVEVKSPEVVPILKDRFELKKGKFGMYFRDTKLKNDLPLEEVVIKLNNYINIVENMTEAMKGKR